MKGNIEKLIEQEIKKWMMKLLEMDKDLAAVVVILGIIPTQTNLSQSMV